MTAPLLLRRAARWAVSLEVWLLIVLGGVSAIFADLLVPALIAAALFWPLRWLARGQVSLPSPLDFPAVLFTLLLPVSLASPLPEVSLPQVGRVLIGMALCYAFANHPFGRAELCAGLPQGVGLGAALSLGALLSVGWFAQKLALIPLVGFIDQPQLIAGLIHPNIAAGTLLLFVMLAPAWLLFAARPLRPWGRLLLLLAAGFTLAVLLLTKSRGAWLGLAAGLALLLILRWPRWGTVAVAALALAAALFLSQNPAILNWLLNGDGIYSAANTLQGRQEIWVRALQQIRQFPLTGFGLGTFTQASYALYPSFNFAAADVPHAHNLFLQIAVDLGLPGLAAWLVMAAIVLRSAWQVYRAGLHRKMGWLAALGAALLAGQTALLIHGLVDAATWGNRLSFIVWGFWGLALAASLFVRRTSRAPSPPA